jgi:uncharacterized membrane protein YeaQ/YmgE (transglycosylase-associated protein family)
MSILAWIVLGAVAGWLASILAGTDQEMGVVANLVVGIVGAFLGGYLFSLFGSEGATGFNLWSLLVAVVGAFILLMLIKLVHHAQ